MLTRFTGRIALLLVAGYLTMVAEQQAEAQEPLSAGRYVAGGLVGTTLGFGVGHAISGEYRSFGWFFTVSEVVGLALVGAGLGVAGKALWNTKLDLQGDGLKQGATRLLTGVTLALSGLLFYAALRLVELVDVWVRPARRLRRERADRATHEELPPPAVGGEVEVEFGLQQVAYE